MLRLGIENAKMLQGTFNRVARANLLARFGSTSVSIKQAEGCNNKGSRKCSNATAADFSRAAKEMQIPFGLNVLSNLASDR